VVRRHTKAGTIERMTNATDVEPNYPAERQSGDPAVVMAELAARQHGVVAGAQLAELGLGRHYIARQVERGRLHAVHRAVYAVGHPRITREGAWMAAVLAGGEGAALGIRSGGALWTIRARSARDIDVLTPRQRRSRLGLRLHHVPLRPDEITVHRAIPVTTPARTLLDLAAILDPHTLARAVERAEALRLTSPTSLAALVARYPRRAGVAALKAILASGSIAGATLTRSELEDRFLTLIDAENLPRPLVNAPRGTNELDFTWRTQRLVVEVDGFETHGTRAAFERDRARDRALLAAGWRVARITWRQLHDEPEQIANELRALLRSATTAAPAPPPGPRTRAPRSRRAAR
jgi:uncharacterized protein DUF559/putative AbiEi antitoxin of type IV toxin-antitoxin system